MKPDRFKVFEKQTIEKLYKCVDDWSEEYNTHMGYGVCGSFSNMTNIGIIRSFLDKCKSLDREGYRNLNFANGGDDDWLVVDIINKEYGFFEDYAPTEENMKKSTTLKQLWNRHS